MSTISILVLNAGSSSIKFACYLADAKEQQQLCSGAVEGIGSAGRGRCWLRRADGTMLHDAALEIADSASGLAHITQVLATHPEFPAPQAIGHRMVSSSPEVTENQRVTAQLIACLERYVHFAPLHTPPALHILRHTLKTYPEVPSFIALDSWFHRDLPEVARSLPIPASIAQMGVHRYGAHGLSYESIVHQLGTHLPQRLIVAHLGNGSSITAIRNGRSVDTSMGLTPTGGLISATRTGEIDPGVLLFLLRQAAESAASTEEAIQRVENMVNRQSGLYGVSELSNDMRTLRRAIAEGSAKARLAVDLYTAAIRKYIGAYIAVLGGLDMLVFTGGIGEHDAVTRTEICCGLEGLGIILDPEENNRPGARQISPDSAAVVVRTMPPDEEGIIVRHVLRLLQEDRQTLHPVR